jgi:DNA-binding NarL/FixJ family response regulator
MIRISYLEEKLLTRTAFQMMIEQQEDCKVIYSGGRIEEYYIQVQVNKQPADICIVSDCYSYVDLLKLIKYIKQIQPNSYILLKSDANFMKGICFLLKNGLNGIFFTDEPLMNLRQCIQKNTKYKLSADKTKLITSNRLGEIDIKELHYNTNPLTQNEIKFIQACTQDQSYEQIAKGFQKSVNTIYGYRDRVFKKLQVSQRTAMVMTALKRNYIDL